MLIPCLSNSTENFPTERLAWMHKNMCPRILTGTLFMNTKYISITHNVHYTMEYYAAVKM